MSNTTRPAAFNLAQMQQIAAALQFIPTNYAMRSEPVTDATYEDGELVQLQFPARSMARVTIGPDQAEGWQFDGSTEIFTTPNQ